MSDIAIRVENLSKLYHIGAAQQRHDTLRDAIVDAFKRVNVRTRARANADTIWALKDVSFDVKRGEVVGIIGRNGSGKSTLLKILSRITEPTEGRAEVHGRVGSLLEVGTGFHPELTGRENIYLNGAILGMRRSEIERKFDEIVAFAEIEKFLDTPVKRYSSGMYVRLAFAVAAHLEPEILLVDEVLAVGDAQFQKKCLGKMGDVAKEGRTVLFVSHNMTAVENLCPRSLLLEQGCVSLSDTSHRVVSRYLTEHHRANSDSLIRCQRRGNGKLHLVSFHIEDELGIRHEAAQTGAATVFVLGFRNFACSPADKVSCSFSIHTEREVGVFHYYSHFSGVYFTNLAASGFFKCLVPELPLSPGNYLVGFRVVMNGDESLGEEADWPQIRIPLAVSGGDFFGTGDARLSTWGPVLVKGRWWLP